jgi:DNA helicase-2/ATP-dependent DNA helicase PcrA
VQEISTANPLDYGSTGGGSFASFSRPYPGSSQYAGRNSYAGSHTYQSSRQEADVASVTSVNSASLRRTAPASSLKPQATLMYGGRQLTVGTRIVHDRFGKGVITALSGKDESARISVHFDTMGDKTLLLKFAKFLLDE